MKQIISIGMMLFVLVTTAGASWAIQPPPLLKVRMKVEGASRQSPIRKIQSALLSIPGVVRADMEIKRKWLFFKNYDTLHYLVEFRHGTLNSETLINAVEWASEPRHFYKVKFIE